MRQERKLKDMNDTKQHTGTKGGRLGGLNISFFGELDVSVAMSKGCARQQKNTQRIYHLPLE